MKRSQTTRTLCISLGLVVSCLIGLPQLYDKFMTARFFALATGLAVVFLIALIGKRRWSVPQTPIVLPYLLFLLLSSATLFWATNKAEAIFAFATLLLTPLVVIVVYTLLTKHRRSTQVALWTSAALILIVYMSFAVIQLAHIESLSFGQLYRVGGINGHKNLLAAMLFLLSAFLLTAFGLFERKALKRGAGILFILSLTLIVLLKSRAVLLSVFVAAAFLGILWLCRRLWCVRHCEEARRSNPDHPLFDTSNPGLLRYARNNAKRVNCGYYLTLAAFIILIFTFFTVGFRWFAERSVPHSAAKSEVETKMTSTSSLVERCLLWEKTYCIADDHPLAGCGIGNWQIHFPDAGLAGLYRADRWNVSFTKPHNEYLGILAETGYLGLLLYVSFLVSLVIKAFLALSATKSKKDFLQGAIALSTFVGCCVNALFDFPYSRIEHLIWNAILMAMLLTTISKQKTLGKGWGIGFLCIALMLVCIAVFRLTGERNSFKMQHAMNKNDWKSVERYCDKAVSVFYTIDPVGLPMHWYQGKAKKSMGNLQAIESFRKAQRHAPYCKENLNDLGLAEWRNANDPAKGERHLKEAIRISPGYLYPQLNLAYLYLSMGQTQKAQEVAAGIDLDEKKREILKADARFFEPFNTEAVRRKIDADYEAVLLLRQTIADKQEEKNSKKNLPNNGGE